MNSNIVKHGLLSSDTKRLHSLFSPSKSFIGTSLQGRCIGIKQYIKIYGNVTQPMQEILINADGNEYVLPYALYGFTNSADISCSDCIYIDDHNEKVYYYKNINYVDLNSIISNIKINKIYDTHSTFQFQTNITTMNGTKKAGVSNLYSDDFVTHRQLSTGIYDSGIVGAGNSHVVYIKMKADDENYFYQGERITDIIQLRGWLNERNVRIFFERETPIITDITDTQIGKALLKLQPQKDFSWSINGALAEMSVYCNINDVLSEIMAMVLEQ